MKYHAQFVGSWKGQDYYYVSDNQVKRLKWFSCPKDTYGYEHQIDFEKVQLKDPSDFPNEISHMLYGYCSSGDMEKFFNYLLQNNKKKKTLRFNFKDYRGLWLDLFERRRFYFDEPIEKVEKLLIDANWIWVNNSRIVTYDVRIRDCVHPVHPDRYYLLKMNNAGDHYFQSAFEYSDERTLPCFITFKYSIMKDIGPEKSKEYIIKPRSAFEVGKLYSGKELKEHKVKYALMLSKNEYMNKELSHV